MAAPEEGVEEAARVAWKTVHKEYNHSPGSKELDEGDPSLGGRVKVILAQVGHLGDLGIGDLERQSNILPIRVIFIPPTKAS